MKSFKASLSLFPYLEQVLKRSFIPYQLDSTETGWLVTVPLSGEKFHKYVMRALCEKKTQETGLLYLTKQESEDEEFVNAILEQTGKDTFLILGKQQQ